MYCRSVSSWRDFEFDKNFWGRCSFVPFTRTLNLKYLDITGAVREIARVKSTGHELDWTLLHNQSFSLQEIKVTTDDGMFRLHHSYRGFQLSRRTQCENPHLKFIHQQMFVTVHRNKVTYWPKTDSRESRFFSLACQFNLVNAENRNVVICVVSTVCS